MKTQLELIEELQSKGYNIVTCGQCGEVFIHEIINIKEDTDPNYITCPYCEFNSEPCDFPDLFYHGWDKV